MTATYRALALCWTSKSSSDNAGSAGQCVRVMPFDIRGLNILDFGTCVFPGIDSSRIQKDECICFLN